MNTRVINAVRDFNRFYTAILGVVNNHILESGYSLTEARIMYELSQAQDLTARELKEMLAVDEGYMSRIINKFVKNGILRKKQLANDKRAYTLALTAKGRKISGVIDQQSSRQVQDLIQHLDKAGQEKLAHLITQVKTLLSKKQSI